MAASVACLLCSIPSECTRRERITIRAAAVQHAQWHHTQQCRLRSNVAERVVVLASGVDRRGYTIVVIPLDEVVPPGDLQSHQGGNLTSLEVASGAGARMKLSL